MKVLAAMSGGVDSSVAVVRLLEAGHDVVGVTMKLWGGDSDTGCCSVSDVDDARRVAHQLDVEHHVFNFGDEFEAHVVGPYVADHAAGRTPNPCVECNRRLKFDKLLRRADALRFDAVATGHHARIVRRSDGSHVVARGADRAKDQSYVLYPLTADALSRTLFPIGDMTKAEVRAVAASLSLRTAHKAESQDVCFITRTGGRSQFLSRRIPLHGGPVVDGEGAVVGRTDAIETVTIGQRTGLGLAGGPDRRYVTAIDHAARTVTVGSLQELLVDHVELVDIVPPTGMVTGAVEAQCSAHGAPRPATFDGRCVMWDEPQRRVASGQSVVLYRDDQVAAGGIAT